MAMVEAFIQVGLGIDATWQRIRHSTTLFAQSQGILLMPQVVKSRSSKDLLQVDDFGNRFLTNQTLNRIMEQAAE